MEEVRFRIRDFIRVKFIRVVIGKGGGGGGGGFFFFFFGRRNKRHSAQSSSNYQIGNDKGWRCEGK